MNAENFAYVAGLIDGEGCIHLGVRKGTYRARVTIGMTETARPLLESLREEWGGSLYLLRPATDRWQAAWTWSIQGEPAGRLLEAVAPYLRLKAEQARLALAVETVRRELPRRPNGSGSWTSTGRARCEEIKQQMHALNRKGPGTGYATTAEVG